MINKIKKIVEKYPDKKAYIIGEQFITFKELFDKATYYANLLIREGNSPIIIYGDKSIDVVITILASILAKRAYVPVSYNTPIDRLKSIKKLCKSNLIISNSNVLNAKKLNDLENYKNDDIKIFNNNIAYIIFTSGSTGEPKGVPISYNNLNNFINWISSFYPLNTYKFVNVFNQANFSFDLSVADFYYSLCNGHSLYAFDGMLPNNYDELYNILKVVNIAVMTPTFMRLCLLDKDFNEINYPNFKCVYFCGEQLDVSLVSKLYNRFSNLSIINAYGPTEATSAVSGILITDDMLQNNILPVGDLNNLATIVEIVDNEIILKGESVFSGYLGNIKGGYYKENDNNCYKTGDIGFIKNNLLYCNGRLDNQIKYKGYRIELLDIENNIKKIQGIIDVCVVPKYGNKNSIKGIYAYCITKKSEIEIRQNLKNRIPDYMIPNSFIILDHLPINKNGKIDRKALEKL